jgi:hypothetical protein
MYEERAEAFFPLADCSLPLAADPAGKAPTLSSLTDEKACRLAPPQHGAARSGASDDDGGRFSMLAPPISQKGARA